MGVIKTDANVFHTVVIDGQPTSCPVVYETRKNRATGSHTLVVDARAYGSRFIAVCVTHGTQDEPRARLAAEARSHVSAEWCEGCQGDLPPEGVQLKRQAQARPRNVVLDAMPDEVRIFAGMFPLVTWGGTPAPAPAPKRAPRRKRQAKEIAA